KVFLDDRTRERSAAIIGHRSRYAFIRMDLDGIRILARPHPLRPHLSVGGMNRHRVGNQGVSCPPASPILRLTLICSRFTLVPASDRVEFHVRDFHVFPPS